MAVGRQPVEQGGQDRAGGLVIELVGIIDDQGDGVWGEGPDPLDDGLDGRLLVGDRFEGEALGQAGQELGRFGVGGGEGQEHVDPARVELVVGHGLGQGCRLPVPRSGHQQGQAGLEALGQETVEPRPRDPPVGGEGDGVETR